jgi:signal transduction histidine kinase
MGWRTLFVLGAFLNGIGWGLAPVLLFGGLGAAQRVFFAMVISGMVAGAAVSTAGYPPAFLAYSIPAMAPLLLRLALGESAVEGAAALLGSIFALAMGSLSRDAGRTLAEALELRFRNEGLVRHLTLARERLAAANAELEDRVRERSQKVVEMERQLAQAALLASVGSLAAGVAHDVNNPLSSLTSSIAFVERELMEGAGQPADPAACREALSDARLGALRVSDIVRNLREVARIEGSAEPLDVEAMLRASVAVASSEIAERARVVLSLGPVPPVLGDRASFSQLFLMLLMSAARAIAPGRRDEHEITLSARLVDEQVVVEVCDTGATIPPEQIAEVFEPSFGGRPGGPPLPLWICRGLAGRLGGTIGVLSEVGRPTRFTVRLPGAPPQE